MKAPEDYLVESRRRNAWAFGVFAFVVFLLPVLLYAVYKDRDAAAAGFLAVVVLLCLAGLRLLALARRSYQRALAEELMQSREVRAVSRRRYPAVLSNPYQPSRR